MIRTKYHKPEPEEPEEIKIIRKAVWSFVKSKPDLEFEEAFSEACLSYMENISKYNPERGAKSTFIWKVVTSRLINVYKSGRRRQLREVPIEENQPMGEFANPEHYVLSRMEWEEVLANFSPEANTLYHLIQTEDSINELAPKQARGVLKRKLLEIGCSHSAIWSAFKELRAAIR